MNQMPGPMTVAQIRAHNERYMKPPLELPTVDLRKAMKAAEDFPSGNAAGSIAEVMGHPEVIKAIIAAKWATTEEAAAFFLNALMLAISHLAQGNQLVTGKAIDDALTHFLAELKAEHGDKFAANAASLIISNLCLFLPEAKRERVMAVLDME